MRHPYWSSKLLELLAYARQRVTDRLFGVVIGPVKLFENLLGPLFFGLRDKVEARARRECEIRGDDLGEFVAFFAYDEMVTFGLNRFYRGWIVCKDNLASSAKRLEQTDTDVILAPHEWLFIEF